MSFLPPITIANAIQKIEFKAFLLPSIQREFVWKCDKIELLFDSLMRDYPIGSFLTWKVNGNNKSNHRYYAFLDHFREKYNIHSKEVNVNNLHEFEAVLDGQQRLTALYIGLKGSYGYKKPMVVMKDNEQVIPTRKLYIKLSGLALQDDSKGDVADDGRYYDFKFLTPDDIFKDKDNIWFEVGDIMNHKGTFKLNSLIKDNDWTRNEFINETLSRLHDIVHVNSLLHFYQEDGNDYDKALNIFIRVNNQGEPLDYSDLVMSTTIAGWKNKKAREEIISLVDEISNVFKITINKDIILRAYLMLFRDDIKFRATNFTLKNAREFEDNWNNIKGAIYSAYELIHSFGYVDKTLTSKNSALPIIYYLFKTNKFKSFSSKVIYKYDREIIKRWLHAVLLHKIFGTQADSILKIIRDAIAKEIQKGCKSFPAGSIANKLSKTRKSITVDDEFIENLLLTKYDDRYSFPILAILYPHLDYKNNDFHKDHIHPKSCFNQSYLKKMKISTDKSKDYTDKKIYDGILNLQLLDLNQNTSKQDKTLAQWVKTEKVDLVKQLIPNILDFNLFPKFIKERRKILTKKLVTELTFID